MEGLNKGAVEPELVNFGPSLEAKKMQGILKMASDLLFLF